VLYITKQARQPYWSLLYLLLPYHAAAAAAAATSQVVDEVFDAESAAVLGLGKKGTVCIMIHSGSRGLGHKVRGTRAGLWDTWSLVGHTCAEAATGCSAASCLLCTGVQLRSPTVQHVECL
jgi:hypothetical protein